jgi:hypothetical protein
MPAKGQDATIYVGEDVTLRVTMSPPTNISGWTIEYTTAGIAKDASIIDAEAGVFEVSLASNDTGILGPGSRPHAFWRMDENNVRPLTLGALSVVKVAKKP